MSNDQQSSRIVVGGVEKGRDVVFVVVVIWWSMRSRNSSDQW